MTRAELTATLARAEQGPGRVSAWSTPVSEASGTLQLAHQVQDLGPLPPYASASYGTARNQAGQVVGDAWESGYPRQEGFLWTRAAPRDQRKTRGCGRWTTSAGTLHGVCLDLAEGTVRHLGGAVESLATGVNEAGLVIGRYKYSWLTDHPLAWDPAAHAVADLNDGISGDAGWEDLTMRKPAAAAASAAFFVLAPGVVAGLVPWWLTGWRMRHPQPSWVWVPLRVAGGMLIAAGVVVLVQAFVRFVAEGVGSPAPVAPTQRLVVGGLYRYVRNPMYLAVVAIIVGQALALAQPVLLGYAVAVGAAMVGFVHGYEEPTLARRFGEQYQAYRHAVPAWWPRRQPWQPGEADPPPPR